MRLRAALLVALVLVAGTMAGRLLRPPEAPLTGQGTAVDGDTLRLDGKRVRLLGLDAPELAQTCRNDSGADWSCGTAAQALMRQLLQQGVTSCAPEGRDRYGRVLAHCAVAGQDVGAAVVTAGLAISDGDYLAEEQQARTRKTGLWAGDFMAPAAWRRSHGEAPSTFSGTVRGWFAALLGQ